MKVKAISRLEEDFSRERKQDLQKVFRNLDPALHPFDKAHEYKRALNATKLDKVFAKPFVCALSGHSDGVSCISTNPKRLNCVISGAANGELKVWDLPFRRVVQTFEGHRGWLRGVTVSPDGLLCVSCGDDCSVRVWRLAQLDAGETIDPDFEEDPAVTTLTSRFAFKGVDHHRNNAMFATAGAQVDVWDHSRSEPVHTFSWGADTVYSVRFNTAEPDVFASTASDRSLALYDIRAASAIRKIIMQTKSNALCWNPREAFNFTVANEDCHLYTYDMRYLSSASCIHKDHVGPVMSVDYAPTGREFVTGSYDRTIRLFAYNGSKSREVYHTKRMQRVYTVRYSGDATYVLSGSDDMNVRLWKAHASEKLGVLLPREKQKFSYQRKLRERFKHLPEISRIDRHKHVPKAVYNASKLRATMLESERKKEQRRRAHTKPENIKYTPARKARIVAEVE
eukprot:jgi/Mesvir1/21298/Mv21689-RA.1